MALLGVTVVSMTTEVDRPGTLRSSPYGLGAQSLSTGSKPSRRNPEHPQPSWPSQGTSEPPARQAGQAVIYQIRCLPTAEVYVGSTTQRIEARFGHHRSRLRAGWHRSRRLQAAWRKHGESAFAFDVIEVVPERERSVAEHRAMRSCNAAFNTLSTKGWRLP